MQRIEELTRRQRREILDRSVSTSEVSEAVADIVSRVREEGDDAVGELTGRFDGVDVENPFVSEEELERAVEEAPSDVVEAVKEAAGRIREFHERQRREDWTVEEDSVEVGRRFTALDSSGCYVPGGGAAYPSTALMTVVPAKVAGVERVVAATPPPVPDVTLAALHVAGVDRVYRAGGAQAVAALALGTESLDAVDCVVGPGNRYVTEAKKQMRNSGRVRVEFPAGPSEIAVVCDRSADPEFVAADVVAQCEHDSDSHAVVSATGEGVAEEIEQAIDRRLKDMERRETAEEARRDVLVGSFDRCLEFVDSYAPEHLSVVVDEEREERVVDEVAAGSVFVGNYSPVAVGDYASGTNHVLPTAGNARLYGGLSVDDFLRSTTVQKLSKEGLRGLGDVVTTLARAEGLYGHADSVDVRFDEG